MIGLLTLFLTPAIIVSQYTFAALFTVPFLLLFAGLTLDYSAAIMNSLAVNEPHPPLAGAAIKDLDNVFVIKHAAVVFGFAAAVGITFSAEGFLWASIGVLLAFLLPSALMILARDRELATALNPSTLKLVVKSLGRDYIVIWLVGLLIFYCMRCTVHVIKLESLQLGLAFFWMATLIYCLFFLYALCGYALFYYQRELGMRIHKVVAAPPMTKAEFMSQRALGESGVLMAEKKYDEAREMLQSLFATHKNDIELHSRYHIILMKIDDPVALQNHTNHLVGLLFAADRNSKATGVYIEALQKMGEFSIVDAKNRLLLAVQLRAERQTKLAITLLKSFHQQFPGSALIKPAYELAAEILSIDLGDHEGAEAVRDYLKNEQAG